MPKDLTKLRSSIKQPDGWWASIFAGPLANRLLEPICELKFISPNLLTCSSLLTGVIAAYCFSLGEYKFIVVGGILVQLSFVIDCMDGQLARYRQHHTDFGAWLDRVSDRVKDFLYFLGLAYGYFSIHLQDWHIWPLAMIASATIFLIDYYVNQDIKLKAKSFSPVEQSSNSPNPLKAMLKLGLWVYRSIPILRFNIGEQALLLSIFCFIGDVKLLMVCFSALGIFYSIYWPFAKLSGYTETKVSLEHSAASLSSRDLQKLELKSRDHRSHALN